MFSKELSHPKHMFKLMDKKIIATLRKLFLHHHTCIQYLFACWFCLFDLILYFPVNNLSVMSGQVFLGRTSTKLGLMCLAQGFACWVMFNDSLLPPVFVCVCVLFKTRPNSALDLRRGSKLSMCKQSICKVQINRNEIRLHPNFAM